MKRIRHISALITLMLIFFACGKRSQQAEPLIFDDQPVVELSDSNRGFDPASEDDTEYI